MAGLFHRKQQVQGLVGVVIGDDSIVIAHVVAAGNRSPEVRLSEVIAGDNRKARQKSFNDLVDTHKLAGAACNVVLSPKDYSLVLLEAPPVKPAEMAAALRWKVKELIDFPVEEAALDYFPVPEGAYRNQENMVYAVAVRKSRIIEIRDFIEESGLELASIDIPELVMRNLSMAYADDANGIAFIDLESGGSTLNLSKDGQVYLTRRLNTQLSEDVLNSEEWEQVMDRLVLEIQRSLDYFESQMGQPQIGRLLLAPRAEDSEALISELNQAMSVRVELMDLNTVLQAEQQLPLARQQHCLLALGAALRADGVMA